MLGGTDVSTIYQVKIINKESTIVKHCIVMICDNTTPHAAYVPHIMTELVW